jgi:hypothetical protein
MKMMNRRAVGREQPVMEGLQPRARARAASAAATGLAASGVVHLALVQDHHTEAWWLGVAFLIDGAALLSAAVWLARRRSAIAWRVAGALCAATVVAYCLSRVIGLPGAHRELWDLLGIATTAVELCVVMVSLRVLPIERIARRVVPVALAATILAGAAYAAAPPGVHDPFEGLNPVTAEFLRDMLRHGHITEKEALRYR